MTATMTASSFIRTTNITIIITTTTRSTDANIGATAVARSTAGGVSRRCARQSANGFHPAHIHPHLAPGCKETRHFRRRGTRGGEERCHSAQQRVRAVGEESGGPLAARELQLLRGSSKQGPH